MIPRTIHYCWFGPKKMPNQSKRFIKDWKIKNPSFRIIKWSESNFNVNKYLFTKKAYRTHNWAAISDYVRLFVLNKFGGIYLDTDVEDIKPLSPLLGNNSFLGMETVGVIASGLIFGCSPHDYNVKRLLKIYNKIGCSKYFNKYANDQVYISTMYFTKYGFRRKNVIQKINNCTIYPTYYFCPQKRTSKKIHLRPQTYTCHHYYGSWIKNNNITSITKINILISNLIIRLFGMYSYRKISNLYHKIKI